MATTKYVYSFGSGQAEGSSVMRNLLGGKGCELAEMTNLGIPVPPGFTITTQAWAAYNRTGRSFPDGLCEQVEAARSVRCSSRCAPARACRCPA
jgi:pyruvate, orthophosphate dikinase